jgi:hypothetical protein
MNLTKEQLASIYSFGTGQLTGTFEDVADEISSDPAKFSKKISTPTPEIIRVGHMVGDIGVFCRVKSPMKDYDTVIRIFLDPEQIAGVQGLHLPLSAIDLADGAEKAAAECES